MRPALPGPATSVPDPRAQAAKPGPTRTRREQDDQEGQCEAREHAGRGHEDR